MLLAAHQPNYLPNLGFFYKMAHVDRFVVFTNIQFAKSDDWVRRHKIKGANGDIWLTVPVLGSGQNQIIRDVHINNESSWQRKHARTLNLIYGKTKEKDILEKITKLYDKNWDRLADLNLAYILLLKNILKIETPLVFDEEVSGKKHDLLINICEKHKASAYLSGAGGKEYMTDAYYQELAKRGIEHHFIEKNLTPLYPYTTLHYLFTEGLEKVIALIKDTAYASKQKTKERQEVPSLAS